MTHYLVIAHTESYAGNFERESIAYATGQLDHSGVGSNEVHSAKDHMEPDILAWWNRNAMQVEGDSGKKTAFIYPTPGFFNNGLGGHFPETEDGRVAALVHFKKQKKKYILKDLGRLSSVVIGEGNWTERGLEENATELRSHLESLKTQVKLREHPAYMSVGIKVEQNPPPHVMRSFEERMREFLVSREIKLSGFEIKPEVSTPAPTRVRAKI